MEYINFNKRSCSFEPNSTNALKSEVSYIDLVALAQDDTFESLTTVYFL